MRDFELSMPLLWDDQLQENLPWRVQGMGLFSSFQLSLRFWGIITVTYCTTLHTLSPVITILLRG